MHLFHHIMISRVLAVVTFAMFLVLTPRAWVEPGTHDTEEVPVDVLEAPSDNGCLWCDPKPAHECDDSEKSAPPPSRRPWLNPDESVVPIQAPCPADEKADPHA
jgi:hypothetical protein